MKNKLVFVLALLVIVLTGCTTQEKPKEKKVVGEYVDFEEIE